MDQYSKDLKEAREQADKKNLNLLRMIESRIGEIVQIENEIKRKFPKQFHQRLPRFMRRRAASHNPKRLPAKLRPVQIKDKKDRKRLLAYRQRLRFRKRKRILRERRNRHKFKDTNKSLLHKWFVKRFKMGQPNQVGLEFVPLYNNTKNQRNLYRQSRSGCAYLSLGHMISIRIELAHEDTRNLAQLNRLTTSVSGFTFSARSLDLGKYEVVIHLYKQANLWSNIDNADGAQQQVDTYTARSNSREYLCPALVSNRKTHLIMWLPRDKLTDVTEELESLKIAHVIIKPRDCFRVRLLGPCARNESKRLAEDRSKHLEAIEDVEKRLMASYRFGASIGRLIIEKDLNFIYYQTNPYAVDICFHERVSRLIWHSLIKNKAHLVGGLRDLRNLLDGLDCFKLEPDFKLSNRIPKTTFDSGKSRPNGNHLNASGSALGDGGSSRDGTEGDRTELTDSSQATAMSAE